MLDALARIYDDAGRLLGVTYTLFEGGPRFVTSVALRFESLTAWFRAVPDDDTLAVEFVALPISDGESVVDVSAELPWADCLECGVSWAWRMTNQQGYTDGIRFEFGRPNEVVSVIVELVVVASAIRLFVSREAGV
jgi:hypothetical protein